MGVKFLGELIKKGSLKILASADRHSKVADMLKRTDLAIGHTGGYLVAEDLGTLIIRPELAGSFDMEVQPNYYQRTQDSFDKEVLSEMISVSVDELVSVEVLGSSVKEGMLEENYRILLFPERKTGGPYLTVQSFYKPTKIS